MYGVTYTISTNFLPLPYIKELDTVAKPWYQEQKLNAMAYIPVLDKLGMKSRDLMPLSASKG